MNIILNSLKTFICIQKLIIASSALRVRLNRHKAIYLVVFLLPSDHYSKFHLCEVDINVSLPRNLSPVSGHCNPALRLAVLKSRVQTESYKAAASREFYYKKLVSMPDFKKAFDVIFQTKGALEANREDGDASGS